MDNDNFFVEQRKKENLREVVIPNKNEIYLDLLNIEHSLTGMLDNVADTFTLECVQMLINSLELFEMGYFDCAFFSLRSVIDLSTTMVFLSDIQDYEERNARIIEWNNLSEFHQRLQMIKKLKNEGNVFIEMLGKMPSFFDEAEKTSKILNKYVHKQGLMNFYISRNNIFNFDKYDIQQFTEEFITIFNRVVKIFAVMRLAIDPLPVLLMDEDIKYRCYDSLTDPYSQKFVDQYIGSETLDDYKKTEMYLEAYNYFISQEKKNDAIYDIIKYKYIDTRKIKEIKSQFYMLSNDDKIATAIALSCIKINRIYCYKGLLRYDTERHSNREVKTRNSKDFERFKNAEFKYNQEYENVLISVFLLNNNLFFVEHNDPLDDEDISTIKNIQKF